MSALKLLVVLCGTAMMAAGQAPKQQPAPVVIGRAMNGPPKNMNIPPNTKYKIITPGFHKRKYEVACSEKGRPGCYVGCPANCPNKCLVFCSYCMSFCMCDIFPGTSCGDPRFTGGDGNTFYFHGKKDENFCILSDNNLHINAHFIGNHNPDLKRDFTWVQALGISFGDHRLYIGARRSVEWDEEEDHIQITLDGEPVDVDAVKNARWTSKALSVTRMDAVNTVMVELDGVFSISANAVPITDDDNRIHKYGRTNTDSLVHLDLGFKFHALTNHVDGVLGQTYRPNYVNKLDIRAKMPIMGGAPKYIVSSSSLFSTDCAVSRFHHRNNSTSTRRAVVSSSAS
ncbi:hypothetical protein PR202_ga08188 [Eleusine coracana subsp. coracana]|uniref:Root cap n=1 Tax=Eleusine coracana subsp. coracana TaxID=191504 RepID=A0AAV5C1V2_ELECO|nr:hypothetical protein QOZ80_1AG0048020 [Eleusine coracana subsp. coracana]GJM91778.1 hypothetical protein PR202_ga08188 [Eleusine coracana subsp. coracana]